MTSITRDPHHFSDDDIYAIARSVQSHDHNRIAPPAQVWDELLAEIEEDTANSEALARRRSAWVTPARVLSMAAATVLVFFGFVAAVGWLNGQGTTTIDEIAAASMTDTDLPVATTATAQARVVCENERCVVDIDLSDIPDTGNAGNGASAGDAYLELWVINSDVSDMHSLGVVTESGSFALPLGVTPQDFPIVDISIEPRDGVAAHSGQSVLRGVFEQA